MPYQLIVPATSQRRIFQGAGGAGLLCPAPTNNAGTYDYEYEYEVKADQTEFTLATKAYIGDSANMHFLKATVLEVRDAANTQINITHGATITNWNVYRVRVDNTTGTRRLRFSLNNGADQTFTPSASVAGWQVGALLPFPASNRGGKFRYFKYTDNITPANNRMYDARVWEPGTFGNTVVPETTSGAADALMDTGYPTDGSAYELYGATPISFTGTVPNQAPPYDVLFELDLRPYFAGNLTPFSYTVDQTSPQLPPEYSLIDGVISGIPVADWPSSNFSDVTGLKVRATDSGGNFAVTNAFDIVPDFNPQPPQGTVTLGTPTGITSSSAAIPYSYSASDQAGFEYRLNGGSAQNVTTTPLVVSGLTASTAYTVEIRAVNAAGAGAWSAPANFTTSAAALPPQGSFTIGTITAAQTTASVPYTYSAADQTSIQYRLNGGSAVTATASPQALSGLTASTAYTIEFRAVNANGNGNWSAPANFTTQAAPVAQGTITLAGLKNNTGTPLANQSGYTVDVYNLTTGALVVRKTGLTTSSQAALVVTDAAIVAGTEYRCIIHNGTAQGVVRAVAA